MKDSIIHALVQINNWGNDSEITATLRNNNHIISIFHTMGRHSFLLDANFDNKDQLSAWISIMKSISLGSGVPAILSIQTQRIIQVYKQKEDFTMQDYLSLKERYHFFLHADVPHNTHELIELLQKNAIVYSALHIQGENSITAEIIVEDYAKYKNLLAEIKNIKNILHLETQEVISVIKYRNQIVNKSGELHYPDHDMRELYTL